MSPSRFCEAHATYGYDKSWSTSTNRKHKTGCGSENLCKSPENYWHVFFTAQDRTWLHLQHSAPSDTDHYDRRTIIILGSWKLELVLSSLCKSVCLETDELNQLPNLSLCISVMSMIMHYLRSLRFRCKNTMKSPDIF